MMTSDNNLSASAARFWTAFDKVEAQARKSPVGIALLAAGFNVVHTGGGCMAWHKSAGEFYAYITNGDSDLGVDVEQGDLETFEWAVGVYNKDADFHESSVKGLDVAIAWCTSALMWASNSTEFDFTGFDLGEVRVDCVEDEGIRNVPLNACFPDDLAAIVEATRDIAKHGRHVVGGGAAPIYTLVPTKGEDK